MDTPPVQTEEQALSHSLDRDVPATYASTEKLHDAIDYKPNTTIQEGHQQFTDWSVGYDDVELFPFKGE